MGEEAANKQFKDSFDDLFNIVGKLKKHTENSGLDLVNPEVTLVGLPNAGKSSLFNILLEDNRAIVSEIAGTTRDYISENIKVGDVLFRLVDTAGIRTTTDQIESAGIERSLELLKTSFYKILLINPFEFDIDYFKTLKNINFDKIIFTHLDRENSTDVSESVIKELSHINFEINGPIEPINFGPMGAKESGPIEPTSSGPMGAKEGGPIEPKKSGPIGATLTKNTDKLLNLLINDLSLKYLESTKSEPILIERHKDVINKLYFDICNYRYLSSFESDISIISSELNNIGHCISELIGIVSPDDVLHNIFNNFCIGK